MAPMVVDVGFGQRAFEQRRLQPFGPHRQRDAHFAGEAGVVARAGVEAGMGEAGGGCREADIGGGAQGGEEALFGVAVDGAGLRDAQLQAAFRADDARGAFRLLGLGKAGGGEGQGGFPALGEVGVGIPTLGEHRAVEAGRAGSVAGVAGAFEFGQEGGVLQGLFPAVRAGFAVGHGAYRIRRNPTLQGGPVCAKRAASQTTVLETMAGGRPIGPRRTNR